MITKEQHAAIEAKANEVYLQTSEYKLHFLEGIKEVLENPEKYGLVTSGSSEKIAEAAFNAGANIFINSMRNRTTPYNSFNVYWDQKKVSES